jgi:hypothetical protein
MRYPRTVFVFDTPNHGIDQEYFQMISSSSQKIYIRGHSKPIGTIDSELDAIKILDGYLNFTGPNRSYMVIGNLKHVEFIATSLADKYCSIYWLMNKNSALSIRAALGALLDLHEMEALFNEALYYYTKSRDRYQALSDSTHISNDDFPQLIADIINGGKQVELRADIESFLCEELHIGKFEI